MTYDEMIEGFRRAGHDVSHMTKPELLKGLDEAAERRALSEKARNTSCSTLSVETLAHFILDMVEPLEERVKVLEAKLGVKVAVPVRLGERGQPVYRMQAPTRRI